MKLLVLLLVVTPMVFGEDYAKLWQAVEEKLKENGWELNNDGMDQNMDKGQAVKGWVEQGFKGWGEDKRKQWNDEWVKVWEEKHKNWADEKKDWKNDDGDDDDEKRVGWGEKVQRYEEKEEHRRWGLERKTEEEKKDHERRRERVDDDRKRGDERHRRRDDNDEKNNEDDVGRYRGWGDNKRRNGDDDKKDDDNQDDTDKKDMSENASLFVQFKSWFESRPRHDQEMAEDEYKEYIKRNIQNFKEYMRQKNEQQEEEKEAKAAIYRQMEKVHMKKLLNEKLYSLTEEYRLQKLKFVFEITEHFTSFCQCDNTRNILQRIYSGDYGSTDDNYTPMNDAQSPNMNKWAELYNGTLYISNTTISQYMNDPPTKMEKIRFFESLSREDRVKLILHEYIEVMCSSAKQLTNILAAAEPDVYRFRHNKP